MVGFLTDFWYNEGINFANMSIKSQREIEPEKPKPRGIVDRLSKKVQSGAKKIVEHLGDNPIDTLRADAGAVVDHLRYATQERAADVAHRERYSLFPYDIIKPEPANMEKWKKAVDEIISAIKADDPGKLGELLKKRDGKYFADANVILEHVKTEKYDEHSTILTAIGLFVLREKSAWGHGSIRLKVLAGGRVKMEDLLTAEGRTNCIDAAAIEKEIAAQYGISGEVKKINPPHGYFLSDHGKVLDSFFGARHGGVYETEADYKKFVDAMPLKDKLGIDFSKILPGRRNE